MTITVNPDLNLVVEQPLSRLPLAVVKLPRGPKVPILVQFARDGAVIDPSEALTSGTLVVGLYYKITAFVAGDSFTNVGAASNATSVYFLCTATTPTTWTNSSTLQQCDSAGVLFSLIFSVKKNGEYDGAVLVLASGTDFTKFGTGTSTIFKSKCSFSTAEINTLLGVDASVANDESEVTLMGEVSWLGPDESKAFPFQIDLQNDSYKTNDVVTSTPGVQAMSLVTTSTEALLTGSRVITGSSTVTVTLAAGLVTLSVPSGLVVPSQTGNSGKYLTTNGAATSWGTDIDAALGNKLDTSAQAADVNPGGTDIALALAAKLPLSGGTMDENAIVNLFNGSKWQQSTPDKGIAGTAGFSVICSVGYEYKFALGYLFILSDGSSTVRKVLYAPAAPTTAADTTLGFTTDTTWEMADGTLYRCTDVAEGAAVWEMVASPPTPPYNAGNLTGDVTLDLANGSAQFGYMSGSTVFLVPTGTPVECGSEITMTIQWANSAFTLDFHANIQRASDSAATFPKTLTAYKSYVFKLKYMGGAWCLVSLIGGFTEFVD